MENLKKRETGKAGKAGNQSDKVGKERQQREYVEIIKEYGSAAGSFEVTTKYILKKHGYRIALAKNSCVQNNSFLELSHEYRSFLHPLRFIVTMIMLGLQGKP